MPRLNRDKLFQKSFESFMVSLCDIYYPELKDWNLECKTEKKSLNMHKYELFIPKKTILFSIDVPYNDEDGIEQPPTDVFYDQEVPTIEHYENYFYGYFNGYSLLKNDKYVSYTSITEKENTKEGDIKMKIVVCYYKSHLPYPSKPQTKEQLLKSCKILEEKNKELQIALDDAIYDLDDAKDKFSILKKKINKQKANTTIKINNIVLNMEKKIRELYGKLGEDAKEDCPVCFETINSESLTVPSCCHYICIECYIKCNKCPMCRSNYIT